MPIGRVVFVECIGGEVQHAIVQTGIPENQFVGLCLAEYVRLPGLGDKLLIIQIPFVDSPHVDEAKQCDARHRISSLQLTLTIEKQQSASQHDNEQAAPGIGCQQGFAHLIQVGKHRSQLLGRYSLLQRRHLLSRHVAGKENTRSHRQNKGNACGKSEAHYQSGTVFFPFQRVGTGEYLFQSQHRQQGNGKFRHHQDGRHRPEFVVHRNVVDEEVRQPHEVLSPRKKNGEEGSSYQRPLQRTFDNEAPQKEKEKDKGTHIHGTCRHRLIAEILRQLRIQSAVHRIRLFHRSLAFRQRNRRPTLYVRHEESERFIDSIAPLRDIIAVEPAARLSGGSPFMLQLAFSPHGFLAVLIRMVQVRQVGAYANQPRQHKHGARFEKMGQFFVYVSLFEIGSHHKQDEKKEIIAHLNVVRLNLKGDKQGCNDAPQQVFLPVRQHHPGNRRRDIGQRYELPDMPRRNEDKEVGGKGPDHSAQAGQPGRQAERPQQDVEAEHHDERQHHVRRKIELIDILYPLQRLRRIVARRHLVSGHASEDGVRPTGTFARALEVFRGFLPGADSRHRIVLKQNASFDIRRKEIGKRKNDKS